MLVIDVDILLPNTYYYIGAFFLLLTLNPQHPFRVNSHASYTLRLIHKTNLCPSLHFPQSPSFPLSHHTHVFSLIWMKPVTWFVDCLTPSLNDTRKSSKAGNIDFTINLWTKNKQLILPSKPARCLDELNKPSSVWLGLQCHHTFFHWAQFEHCSMSVPEPNSVLL